MSLYNTSGSQYTAITGKTRRFPYRAFIDAQIPSVYQSKQRKEDQAYADSQLDLETQALEESKRASEASIDESVRVSGIQAGLQEEQMDRAEKQANIGTAISGAQTLGMGYYGGTKLGLWGGKTAATPAMGATVATPAAATVASSAGPTVGVGVAGGNPGLAAASASPGAVAGVGPWAAGAGFFALAAHNASKIYEGFTKDHPGFGFVGGNLKLASNARNYSPGIKSKKFNYSINSKDYDDDGKAAKEVISYLDDAFSQMQSKTDVDLNSVISYGSDGIRFKDGETPKQMVNRIIGKVQNSIKSGKPVEQFGALPHKPYNEREGQYVSGAKRVVRKTGRDTADSQVYGGSKLSGRDASGSRLTGKDTADRENSQSYTQAPVYSDIPGFKGDKSYINDPELDTWICTKTKETVGMTEKEWRAITKLKRYSIVNNKEWFDAYVKIGSELVESMGDNKSFYNGLKKTFIFPITCMVNGGYMEAAYLSYKSIVLDLIKKYNPSLINEAPEAN